jgi:ATP-dependent RNA helicase DOB1
MSGRAGRRGKDDRGIVIQVSTSRSLLQIPSLFSLILCCCLICVVQMLDQRMEPAVCKSILYGSPDPLNSSYRISYNMLLNLMRVEDVDPEYLLRASFHQFQREKDAPAVIAQAESFQQEAESISIGSSAEEAELASQYYQMDQQLLLTRRKIAKIVRQPQYVLKFLSPGRLLDISIDGAAFGWGVLVSCKKRTGTGSGGEAGQLASLVGGPEYILDVLLSCVDRHFDSEDKKGREEDAENLERIWRGSSSSCRPVRPGDDKRFISMRLFTLGLEGIERLSAVKLFVPQDITIPEGRRKVSMSLAEVQRRLAGSIPLLDPVEDLGIKTEEFLTLLKRAEALTERISAHKLATSYEEKERLMLVEAYEKKAELLEKAKALREEARGLQTLSMKDTMKKMKRVLKKLGHVDANSVIQTKGRTACEINTAHELVVVELMFTGVFNDLTVEQCCALLSCMTFDEPKKSEDDSLKGLKGYLTKPFFKLKEVARTVARVEISCGIDVNEEEFVDHFNPGM